MSKKTKATTKKKAKGKVNSSIMVNLENRETKTFTLRLPTTIDDALELYISRNTEKANYKKNKAIVAILELFLRESGDLK